jgi:putative SOS response-associated peptidase YedK
MCGRFSVDKALTPIVSEPFNTHYKVETNANLSPSQSVSTIINNSIGLIKGIGLMSR